MRQRSAAIVGGGIGGLAAAVALGRQGWRVRVYERADAFREVGAGISLWGNALRALDALGLGEAVRGTSAPELGGGIRDWRGRWLARMDPAVLARRHGPTLMLHRADLLQVLLDAVPPEALSPGHDVTSLDDIETDVIVGADGIASTVRGLVFPAAGRPRYAGYTAWRFVTPDPVPLAHIGESWGRGQRFGCAQLPDGRVYWYATASLPAGTPIGDNAAELSRRFAGWHDPVPALVATAAGHAVLRHDIYGLPPLRSFAAGRVALLGDAAHAMTPDLGQGAGQALEDAVVLADALDRAPDVGAGLAAYDADRRPRTQAVARTARRIGAAGQLSSPVAAGVRNALVRLLPASATLRSLAPVLTWTPPGPPGAGLR